MTNDLFTLFAFAGAFGTILTILGWVADNHGKWLDRIPGLPKDDECDA